MIIVISSIYRYQKICSFLLKEYSDYSVLCRSSIFHLTYLYETLIFAEIRYHIFWSIIVYLFLINVQSSVEIVILMKTSRRLGIIIINLVTLCLLIEQRLALYICEANYNLVFSLLSLFICVMYSYV